LGASGVAGVIAQSGHPYLCASPSALLTCASSFSFPGERKNVHRKIRRALRLCDPLSMGGCAARY